MNILYVNINICLAVFIMFSYWILEKYVQYEKDLLCNLKNVLLVIIIILLGIIDQN